MTQIAELTDRLQRLAKRREDEGIYTDAMIASAAADRIAALEAQLAERVKVKQLEWSGHPAGGEQSLAAGLGLYRVHANGDDWYLVPDHMGKGGTAAAQADYARRILSALEATPPAPKVRWRAFEATTRGWWGIELEQSEDEDEPILYPIKARRDSIESIVNAHNSALEATPPAPKVTEAQAEVVAKLITKWLGRSWEGLPEGRVIEKGFPVFSHSQRGWGFNGRKGDMIDLAHEALTAAQEAAPKVTADTIDELRWIMQNLPVEFAMHERCPTDTLMHVITTLSAAQEAGKP